MSNLQPVDKMNIFEDIKKVLTSEDVANIEATHLINPVTTFFY